jgi:hypothetical protein
MFGAFSTMDTSGEWDIKKMRYSFDSITNASAGGKTVIVHAFPGPAGTTAGGEGMFPTRGDTATGNTFHVAAWAGAEKVPSTADGCRQAAADRLVESLAPFLIVVTERVFFGYGWVSGLRIAGSIRSVIHKCVVIVVVVVVGFYFSLLSCHSDYAILDRSSTIWKMAISRARLA